MSMESLMGIRNFLPNTVISGSLGNITIRVNIKDIAEAIAKEIAKNGFRVTYRIEQDNIVLMIELSPQLGK